MKRTGEVVEFHIIKMPYHNQWVEQSWNMVWHFVFAGDAQAGSDIVKLSDLIFDPLHFIIHINDSAGAV